MSKVDHLKEDPPLNGQRYCVFSFVNPEDRVLMKQIYYLNQFMVDDINKMIVAQASHMIKKLQVDMRNRIDTVLDKLKMSVDEEDKHLYRILNNKFKEMTVDEDEFIDNCHRKYILDQEELVDKYKIYLSQNRTKLDYEFSDANGEGCSTRGIKFRGAYDSYEQAANRCKYVRDNVEQGIHAFVIPVGTWVPLDMEADEVQDQDYMLPALNDLMGKYHEGMRAKDAHYHQRKQDLAEQYQRKDVKSRLQETLRKKKHDQIRKDIEDFKRLENNENTDDVDTKAKLYTDQYMAANEAAEKLLAEEDKKSKKVKKLKKVKKSKKVKKVKDTPTL